MVFDKFVRDLRGALIHLYDPDYLRRSAMVDWFSIGSRYDVPSAIQRILIEAVESIRPMRASPARQIEQQLYDILLYRYVQQSEQSEVAHQLAVSTRQIRRLQTRAIEVLAGHLWERYDLGAKDLSQSTSENRAEDVSEGTPSNARDFTWLRQTAVAHPPDPNETLEQVVALFKPLATKHGMDLVVTKGDCLPKPAIHPVALRQALLAVLSQIVSIGEGGEIHVQAHALDNELEFRVTSHNMHTAHQVQSGGKGFQDAHTIAEAAGGRLLVERNGDQYSARLLLPTLDQFKVLVVDDNADFIQLIKRYTDGTRYCVTGLRKPDETIRAAQEQGSQIVILDVMIPDMDGWDVLARLRRHPSTEHIPVIICTVLAQEELAISLGAAAFLQKPIKREELLSSLDRVAVTMATALPQSPVRS